MTAVGVVVIRPAAVDDMLAVCDLYNALIPTTTIGWTEALQTLAERLAWFEHQNAAGHVTLVAEHDGNVVGFCAYDDFRGAGKWPGYRYTVEHTIHVAERSWGQGIGRALLEALIRQAKRNGLHVMVAGIDGDNHESIRFHERLGFTISARMPEVGTKFGRWLELVLMQRTLDGGAPDARQPM